MEEVYQKLGDEGIANMVAAFYRRIPGDDLIGPMYPAEDLAGSEKRLRDFLIFRFGGPDTYIQERGHPRLRMRHVGFTIGEPERDRWVGLMDAAMEDTEIPADIREKLHAFFFQVADFMRNQPS
ncbi:MAG: hemoglobin [Verrucomicrobiales bacterium]